MLCIEASGDGAGFEVITFAPMASAARMAAWASAAFVSASLRARACTSAGDISESAVSKSGISAIVPLTKVARLFS